ncbi:MAG: ankyrin repeat domain-containing protein [Spirochaetes bacterium]|nr:ankyrin repeat domain-containing protein [Spirochaetota bacterium]
MKFKLAAFLALAASVAVSAAPNQDLFKAVKGENAKGVQAALLAGADPNAKDDLGRTPLFYAAARGNVAIAKLLVAKKASPNLLDKSGWGPHTVAMDANFPEMLDYLVKAGLDKALLKSAISIPDSDGFLPIHVVAREGRYAMFSLLIGYGSPVDPVTPSGYTPILLAASNLASGGNRGTMILKLAELGADAARSSGEGMSALDYIVATGDDALVMKLAKAPIPAATACRAYASGKTTSFAFLYPLVRSPDDPGPDGKPLIFLAVDRRDAKLVRDILSRGGSPSARDRYGVTAMQYASRAGDVGIVKMLVESGGLTNDQDAKNAFDAPLVAAAYAGNLELAVYLLGAGANLDKPQGRWTPLQAAVFGGHLDMVKFLVDRGADVNGKGDAGFTILMTAVDYRGSGGDAAIVGYLLDRGADPAIAVGGFGTALDWAEAHGKSAIASLLETRGGVRAASSPGSGNVPPKTALEEWGERFYALSQLPDDRAWRSCVDELSAPDVDLGGGRTPLFVTAQTGNLGRTKYLGAKGANFFAVASDGRTILHAACGSGNLELARYLVEEKRLPVGKKDSQMRSALFDACIHPGMVEWLCGKGGDPGEVDAYGTTLLHQATGFEGAISNGTIRFLIAAGVDVNAKMANGSTALDRAIRMGNTEGAELLRKAGAVEGTRPAGTRRKP